MRAVTPSCGSVAGAEFLCSHYHTVIVSFSSINAPLLPSLRAVLSCTVVFKPDLSLSRAPKKVVSLGYSHVYKVTIDVCANFSTVGFPLNNSTKSQALVN